MGIKAKTIILRGKWRPKKRGSNEQTFRPGFTKVRAFSCPRGLSNRSDAFCKRNNFKFSPIMALALEEFLDRNAA